MESKNKGFLCMIKKVLNIKQKKVVKPERVLTPEEQRKENLEKLRNSKFRKLKASIFSINEYLYNDTTNELIVQHKYMSGEREFLSPGREIEIRHLNFQQNCMNQRYLNGMVQILQN
jgi:hypothetical protein